MQFLIGMMVASALFICSYTAYRYGQMSKQPKKQIDEEEIKRAKRLQEGFNDMMSYDVAQAVKGKKVN